MEDRRLTPSFAIPPAAASPACLWITDDVLSDAFNRFLRVSNAHLYHAKRFRSNAPGPLEARRRATRRKLGVAAVASGSAPPPFDLGALFGLGVKPGADMEKGMKWEGPKTGALADGSFWNTKVLRPRERRREEEERMAQFLELPEDPVEKSTAGFEALLVARGDALILGAANLDPMLDYLQGLENEAEARLTERLLRWVQERNGLERCLPALVDLVKRKLALATISRHEVVSIIHELRSQRVRDEHIIAIAESMPRRWAHILFLDITRQILGSGNGTGDVEELRYWLAFLRKCSLVDGFHYSMNPGWTAVYGEVSTHYRPSELAAHFCQMTRVDAARVLLRHWIPRLAQFDTELAPAFQDSGNYRRLRPCASDGIPPYEYLAVELKKLHGLPWTPSPNSTYRKSPLMNLVQVLAEHNVPYAAILEEIVSIYQQMEPAEKLRNVFMDLIRRPSVGVPTPLATKVVRSFLDSGEVEFACQIFEAVPTVPLSGCFDLPLQLIEKRRLSAIDAFSILSRMPVDDTLPPDGREVHTLSLTKEHIDLVHLVAYAFAKSPHLSPRTAFRRVWECYRFLRDRQAPLDPLLSRALVKAGVSRYISAGERPSAAQTAYVLGIVAQLEGKEMAQRLDESIFTLNAKLRAGQRVGRKSRWGDAQVKRDGADERMLRVVKWRLRGWTTGRARSQSRMRRVVGEWEAEGDPFGDVRVVVDFVALRDGVGVERQRSESISESGGSREECRSASESTEGTEGPGAVEAGSASSHRVGFKPMAAL